VIGKVQLILETLGSAGQLGLSELSRRTGIAKASVHRLCGDLVSWGVVERSGDSFRLGPRLFELGQRVPARRSLCDAALPFMEDLYLATMQTIHLAVLEGTEVMYAVKILGRRSVAVPSQVGSRLPLHCTATGKCMLAFGPAELLQRAVDSGLSPLTNRSVSSPEQLDAELEQVRRLGYALEREQVHLGFASVACPIFGSRNQVVAALAVTSSLDEVSPDRWVPALWAATGQLSRRLGARASIDRGSPSPQPPRAGPSRSSSAA
jgi:DNA-binding IclR family transcriptional regulator